MNIEQYLKDLHSKGVEKFDVKFSLDADTGKLVGSINHDAGLAHVRIEGDKMIVQSYGPKEPAIEPETA